MLSYVHDLNPVLWQITEKIAIRWYGLAYLAGFLAGWYFLRDMAKRKLFPVAPDKISDFIGMAAICGVVIGGRLGYVLLYMLPSPGGFEKIMSDPLVIIRVWDGGMASHGGIIGLAIFTLFYSRKHKMSWTHIGDGLVCVAPLGIFFGRVANYINGELFGKVASHSLPWAVKFPGALFHSRCGEFEEGRAAIHAALKAAPEAGTELAAALDNPGLNPEPILIELARKNPDVQSAIEPFLQPRHPSQIYQALGEGLILFAILMFLRYRFPKLANGIITGLFFILYAVARIFVEGFRVPDANAALVGSLSKGQFYSLFFIIIGLSFLVFGWFQNKKTQATAQKTLSPTK